MKTRNGNSANADGTLDYQSSDHEQEEGVVEWEEQGGDNAVESISEEDADEQSNEQNFTQNNKSDHQPLTNIPSQGELETKIKLSEKMPALIKSKKTSCSGGKDEGEKHSADEQAQNNDSGATKDEVEDEGTSTKADTDESKSGAADMPNRIPAPTSRSRRKCPVAGCPNRVVQGGLCISHGAKRKTCSHPGCTKNVKKAGMCSTHGPARKRCEAEGCTNVVVQGGRCIAHGAKKKVCSIELCTKQAILGGMCKKHHNETRGSKVGQDTEEESGIAKKVELTLVRTPNNKVEPTNEVPATAGGDKSSTNTKSTTAPDTTITKADSTTNIGQQQKQNDHNPRVSAGDRIYLCQLTNDFVGNDKKMQSSGSKPKDADAGTANFPIQRPGRIRKTWKNQRPGRIRACPGGDVVKVLLQLPPAYAKLGLGIENDREQHKGLPVLMELSPNSPYQGVIPPRMLGGAYWIVGVRDESRGYAMIMDCAMLRRELNVRRKPREDSLVEFIFAKRRSEDSLQATSGGNNDQTGKSVLLHHGQGMRGSETMHENQINVNMKPFERKPSEKHQLVTQEQEQKEVKRYETQQKSHEQKWHSLITMQNSKGDNIEQRSLLETAAAVSMKESKKTCQSDNDTNNGGGNKESESTLFVASRAEKWEDMFDCLVEFIEETRAKSTQHMDEAQKSAWIWDGNVPTSYKTPCGKALGRWINNQRSAKAKGTLKDDREARLVSTGLKWSVLTTNSWIEMLRELEMYVHEQTKDGRPWDGNVPTNYKSKSSTPSGNSGPEDDEKNLGRWVNRQRSLFQAGKLKKERQRDLERIGMKWSVLVTNSWIDMFRELEIYVHEQTKDGRSWDGKVPRNYKIKSSTPSGNPGPEDDEKNLGCWVNRQRRLFQAGKLKKDRQRDLERIGLKWSALLTNAAAVSMALEIVDEASSKHKLTQAVEEHQPQKLEEKISLNKRCKKRKSELQQDHGVELKKTKVTTTSNTPT